MRNRTSGTDTNTLLDLSVNARPIPSHSSSAGANQEHAKHDLDKKKAGNEQDEACDRQTTYLMRVEHPESKMFAPKYLENATRDLTKCSNAYQRTTYDDTHNRR